MLRPSVVFFQDMTYIKNILPKNNTASLFFAVLAAAASSYFLSDVEILFLIIFFGQGHFLLAYIYANKNNKINKRFVKIFLALVFSLGSLCLFFKNSHFFYEITLFVTSTVFTFHYLNDEFKIAGMEYFSNKIIVITPLVASFGVFFLFKIFSIDAQKYLFLILSFLFFLTPILYYSFKRISSNVQALNFFLIFYIINFLLPIYFLFFTKVSASQVLGFIIIFHYLRWYLFYFFKLEGGEFDFYIDVVIWVNIFVLFTFIQYILAPTSGFLYLFYSPLFFYAWSIVHIVLFIRKHDYSITL